MPNQYIKLLNQAIHHIESNQLKLSCFITYIEQVPNDKLIATITESSQIYTVCIQDCFADYWNEKLQSLVFWQSLGTAYHVEQPLQIEIKHHSLDLICGHYYYLAANRALRDEDKDIRQQGFKDLSTAIGFHNFAAIRLQLIDDMNRLTDVNRTHVNQDKESYCNNDYISNELENANNNNVSSGSVYTPILDNHIDLMTIVARCHLLHDAGFSRAYQLLCLVYLSIAQFHIGQNSTSHLQNYNLDLALKECANKIYYYYLLAECCIELNSAAEANALLSAPDTRNDQISEQEFQEGQKLIHQYLTNQEQHEIQSQVDTQLAELSKLYRARTRLGLQP